MSFLLLLQQSIEVHSNRNTFIVWVFVVYQADERFIWGIDLFKTDQFWEGKFK